MTLEPALPVAQDDEADAALVRGAALVTILVAFVVGWIGIARVPFDVDESIAVFPARGILAHGLPIAPYDLDFMPWQLKFDCWDPATPLYRYVLALVFAVFGFSETTARGFSWVVAFLALLPIQRAGRVLFGRTTAWLGVALIAGSPIFAYFGREARHFSFVMLLGTTMIWLLLAARSADFPARRRMLWLLPLVGALLAQTIGYLALPVAACYIALAGWRGFFGGGRAVRVAGALALCVWAALLAVFWDTLPFFHDLGCHNRPVGCRPGYLHYLRVLYAFLAPLADRDEIWTFLLRRRFGWIVSAGPPLFLAGAAAAALGGRPRVRREAAMVWVWLLVPLALLSLREVKFPRFLFPWAFPVALLLTAYGVVRLSGLLRSRPTRRVSRIAALALLLLAPQWSPGTRFSRPPGGLSLALGRYFDTQAWNAPGDNWEHLAAQARWLEARIAPGDTVVTSFDDAGLQYYLGRRVYGLLTSRRDDAFFVDLLRDAARRGSTLWFVDTLPMFDFCLTDEPEPRSIRCSEKYPRFYRACSELGEGPDPSCRRVPLSTILRDAHS